MTFTQTRWSLNDLLDAPDSPRFNDYHSQLNELLPPCWSHGNPVDIIGDATAERFAQALQIVLADSGNDGVLVLFSHGYSFGDLFSPKGEHLGTIPTPLQPQNIAFAGADKKTLYIVGRGSAFKVRVLTAAEGTAARVRVLIESGDGTNKWGTVGVSENIIEATWQALADSIEYKLLIKD